MSAIIDITGNTYGRLSVKGLHRTEHKRSYWTCECNCGNVVVLRKDSFAYKYSHQKSCGCLHRENSSERMKERYKHTKKELVGDEIG